MMNVVALGRLIPYVLFFRLKNKSPRDYSFQWNNYWTSINKTGVGGQVLWDCVPEYAAMEDIQRFKLYFDPDLPLIDIGCGNGRQTRFLAGQFKHVIGVDVSAAAIALAKHESPQFKNIDYEVLNVVNTDETERIVRKYGPMNIYMRGVLHVIQVPDRAKFILSLKALLGDKGILYQTELTAAALNYFQTLPGDSPAGVPKLLFKVMENGIQPIGFRPADRTRYFPDTEWNILSEGPSVITTIPLSDGQVGKVPATYLVARPRNRLS